MWNHGPLILCCVTAFSVLNSEGSASFTQQYFRVKPNTQSVPENATVVLPCEVANQAGKVQWTKNMFALGYDRGLPGYSRYSLVGRTSRGEHNLKIDRVSLDDDAEFECQVTPTKDHPGLRAKAYLNVLIPPRSVEILGHPDGSLLEIKNGEQVQLVCMAREAKPQASIRWLRNGVSLNLEEGSPQTMGRGKVVDSMRKLIFNADRQDDGANYTCEVRHAALDDYGSPPRTATVNLGVLYPPGPPTITGYNETQPIRIREEVNLTCTARGGNPPALLEWFRNGELVKNAHSRYIREAQESVNVYRFHADSSDNGAVFLCQSSSKVQGEPRSTSVQMTVLFPPQTVVITGRSAGRIGDWLPQTCKTSTSNPGSTIAWEINGDPLPYAEGSPDVRSAQNGGFITMSVLNVTITPEIDRELEIACRAVNPVISRPVVFKKKIHVLEPPSDRIRVRGYRQGDEVLEGSLQTLTCESFGGNPLSTLTWFRGDEMLTASRNSTSPSQVSATLDVRVTKADNGQDYRCQVAHPAWDTPKNTSVRFSVLFPPEKVRIKTQPAILRAGETATFTCASSSSNPAAYLTWWMDSIVIPTTQEPEHIPAEYGGVASRHSLRLALKASHNGISYKCQATNGKLQVSRDSSITLDVRHKPIFLMKNSLSLTVVEGETAYVNLTAQGNPSEIKYTWQKGNGQPLKDALSSPFITNGPVLTITQIKRVDAGRYDCTAANEEGHQTIFVHVDIQYAPTITKISQPVYIDEGKEAYLECVADANPLTDNMITWHRDNYDFFSNKTRQITTSGHGYLTIMDVQITDTGAFKCIVNNGIGQVATATAYLVVKYAPLISSLPSAVKGAADNGDTATLRCLAEGASNITFLWAREGLVISPSGPGGKYHIISRKLDLVHWESVLTIEDVNWDDYGSYECTAKNELGFSTRDIRLQQIGPPDGPENLRVLNVSHDSAVLKWTPGFDGGAKQRFSARISRYGGDHVDIDVIPGNASSFKINQLELNTQYSFEVKASNVHGDSPFSAPETIRTLRNPLPSSSASAKDKGKDTGPGLPRFLIGTVTIIGVALLVLNVVLISCYVKRRKKVTRRPPVTQKKAETYDETSKCCSEVDSRIPNSCPTGGSIDINSPCCGSDYMQKENLQHRLNDVRAVYQQHTGATHAVYQTQSELNYPAQSIAIKQQPLHQRMPSTGSPCSMSSCRMQPDFRHLHCTIRRNVPKDSPAVVSFAAPMDHQPWERHPYMLSTYEVGAKEPGAGSTATLPVRMKQTQLVPKLSPIPSSENAHREQCTPSPSVLWNPLSQEESQKLLMHLQFQQQVQQQQPHLQTVPIWQHADIQQPPVIPPPPSIASQLPNKSNLKQGTSGSIHDLRKMVPAMFDGSQTSGLQSDNLLVTSQTAGHTAETSFIHLPPPVTTVVTSGDLPLPGDSHNL